MPVDVVPPGVRVVLALVTPAWLADEAAAQAIRAAEQRGKPTLAVLQLDDETSLDAGPEERLRLMRRTTPCLDLAAVDGSGDSSVWARLGEALVRLGARSEVGPDPAAFALDPDAPPYPGLRPFGDTDEEAAVFFGRGRELLELLETLRARRATGDGRTLVVTGPPGVGKSSIVAAGVLPRLRREGPAWTVLRLVRSAGDPLLAFARAIEATLADGGVSIDPDALAAELMAATGDGARAVAARWAALTRALRDATGRPWSTLLWAIDASDALRSDSASAAALRAYVREASRGEPPCRLLLTARDDELEALRRQLSPVPLERYGLRPLPAFRVDEVVAGPAERHGVAVEPELIDDLIEDLPDADRLPHLAACVAQLWRRGEGLRRESYAVAGRLVGVLAEAPVDVRRALGPAVTEPPHRTWLARAALGLVVVLVLLAGASLAGIAPGADAARPFHVERIEPTPLRPEQERALRPGAVFEECRDGCPRMVVLPPGRFLMGDERERDATMLPRHEVTFARPFAVGRTEVTFREYAACIDHGPCGAWPADYRAPEWSADKPVVHLATDRMHAYVGWLSSVTGQRYRLPSSAEWEYMARAGTTTAFFWGDEMLPDRAHCVEGCGSPYRDDRVEDRDFVIHTAPVASFAPNPFGVFDAHGNVWEVVEDCWHETYRGAPRDGSAWREENGGDCRGAVVRGGGWSGAPDGLRAAARDWLPPESAARPMVGFRVARDLDYAAER